MSARRSWPGDELEALVAAELDTPAPAELQTIVEDILARHGKSVALILFYGSCRRSGDMSGLLDLYILYDGHRAFHRRALPALLTSLLPPNVALMKATHEDRVIHAKVAALSRGQFSRRMRSTCLDTTIWARFSQPSSLLYARDPEARRWIVRTVAQGLRTAALWGARLGPVAGSPASQWQALFTQTYRTELRPERNDRPALIYRSHAQWFDQAAILARFGAPAGAVQIHPSRRRLWRLGWALRRLWGKPLNVLRLMKAGLTFENGADYIVWKVERHSGVRIVLSEWQRRHPLLSAPMLLWRLRFRLRANASRS